MHVTGFLYFLFFIIFNPSITPDAMFVVFLIFKLRIDFFIFYLLLGILLVHGRFISACESKDTIEILINLINSFTYLMQSRFFGYI